jgi:hypothetical protein
VHLGAYAGPGSGALVFTYAEIYERLADQLRCQLVGLAGLVRWPMTACLPTARAGTAVSHE